VRTLCRLSAAGLSFSLWGGEAGTSGGDRG